MKKKQLPLILSDNQSETVEAHLYSDVEEHFFEQFSYLTQLPHLHGPIIFLTDIHLKPQLETPSSSVITSEKYISFSMTSPSQNCGMAIIKTPFFKQDFSPKVIEKFMTEVKNAVPLRHSTPVITREDVIRALKCGAHWAVKQYGLPRDTVDNIECSGNLLNEINVGIKDISRVIPEDIIELSKQRFKLIGGGNHFLEIQYVDEIKDSRIADRWGLKKDQIVIMYHTGSDAMGAYLGRLYASRKKTNLKHKLYFFRKKIECHLMQGPLGSIPERIKNYFLPGTFRFINPDTQEGKRALLAINCAANFGFASRIAIFHEISEVLGRIFDSDAADIKLIYDCSHNSIYKEKINGIDVWAHRHNSCRVYPPSLLSEHPVFKYTGQPVILPGTNQTSSFICAGAEGAAASHYTVDHGLGAVQKRYEHDLEPQKLKETVLKYNYNGNAPEEISMLPDTGVDGALNTLNDTDIIRTVARVKPLATLKGPKSKIV